MHNYERGSLKQINVKWVDLSISRIINTMYKPDGMTIPPHARQSTERNRVPTDKQQTLRRPLLISDRHYFGGSRSFDPSAVGHGGNIFGLLGATPAPRVTTP